MSGPLRGSLLTLGAQAAKCCCSDLTIPLIRAAVFERNEPTLVW